MCNNGWTLKANSHRHARHDKTVLSVSRTLRRCELDSRQLKTVADRKFWNLNTLIAIVQFTPPRKTRHRQDCFVVSGVAVWTESARPPDRCVLCLVCVGVRPAAQCDRRTHSDTEALVGPTQFTPPDTTQTGPSCLVGGVNWAVHVGLHTHNIHRVKWRHRIYGHGTFAFLWV